MLKSELADPLVSLMSNELIAVSPLLKLIVPTVSSVEAFSDTLPEKAVNVGAVSAVLLISIASVTLLELPALLTA